MGVLRDRLAHAWNAFLNVDDERERTTANSTSVTYGPRRPDRPSFTVTNERSIITSIYTRISIDVAKIEMRHVRLDDQGRYEEDVRSGLNECLTVEANLDQAAQAFRQDMAYSLLNHGVIAVVPVDTTLNPNQTAGYDIKTMRVGRITQWKGDYVTVDLYNEKTGMHEEITLPKRMVAIAENPLYPVMNEQNSTLQRLIRKLNLLDAVDNQSASGKLDIIIQLPYTIKSDSRRKQAEQRRKDMEWQLSGSKYGVAYSDATEKITQLNRPAENNLLTQIEYLTEMLYGQLGITEDVMNGTADESTMLNYENRTIEPILEAIIEAMIRSFLTKTARSQNQSIVYFRDPFKLVPISSIAEIADKFTRNEVLTPNEVRQIIGRKPSKDPKADKLANRNMPNDKQPPPPESGTTDT